MSHPNEFSKKTDSECPGETKWKIRVDGYYMRVAKTRVSDTRGAKQSTTIAKIMEIPQTWGQTFK